MTTSWKYGKPIKEKIDGSGTAGAGTAIRCRQRVGTGPVAFKIKQLPNVDFFSIGWFDGLFKGWIGVLQIICNEVLSEQKHLSSH
jgi:hypothetical protein